MHCAAARHRRGRPCDPSRAGVEGDDRRHDEHADDTDHRLPARPERGGEAAEDRGALTERVAERFLDVGQAVAHEGPEPALAELVEDALQRGRVSGKAVAEAGDLVAEDRHEKDDDGNEQEDEGEKDDRGRGPARQAETLQPVRDRIEEIGESEARDEGQQDAAEQPQRQHEHDQRDEPEHHLSLKRHRRTPSRPTRPARPAIQASR